MTQIDLAGFTSACIIKVGFPLCRAWILCCWLLNIYMGDSIYDVRTQGGGPGKADKVREFSKGGCVKMQTRVKKSENFEDVINGRP